MPINIGTKKPEDQPTTQPSPHAEAAAALETEVTKTKITDAGGPEEKEEVLSHDHTSTPVQHNLSVPHLLDVGINFKMPLADYTMIGYSIRRVVPYDPAETDPDELFNSERQWIEGQLNQLIHEQQQMIEAAQAEAQNQQQG